MTRAERRYKFALAKAKARRVMNSWNRGRGLANIPIVDVDRFVSHMAETHCRPCSCVMCAHHKSVPPKRERAFMEMAA